METGKLDYQGIKAFSDERIYQIEKYGFTVEYQRQHPEWYEEGQLRYASQELSKEDVDLVSSVPPANWDIEWWRRMRLKPYKDRLRISGALLAAQYEYLYSE